MAESGARRAIPDGDGLAPEAEPAPGATHVADTPRRPSPRQAIVVIHGMGEQRPVETLNEFSRMVANSAPFHSRPMKLEGAFEARMHVIPRTVVDPSEDGSKDPAKDGSADDGGTRFDTQTDIYEYHWSHLMTGNRLNDLWPTFRRMMFPAVGFWEVVCGILALAILGAGIAMLAGVWTVPAGIASVLLPWGFIVGGAAVLLMSFLRRVPPGMIGLWLLIWAAVAALAYAFIVVEPLRDVFFAPDPLRVVLGGASAIVIVAYLISRVLPGWLVKNLVDVVRYLDTGPRSYAVRRDIRKGIVDLLEALHRTERYQRIILVAHSLGSYIAYDAITYFWGVKVRQRRVTEADFADLEAAAGELSRAHDVLATHRDADTAWREHADARERFREEQCEVWRRMRTGDHPWLITDLVTFGSPMNFADQLFTRTTKDFKERIARREVLTCPPVSEVTKPGVAPSRYSLLWGRPADRKLHEAAPFAVVRWTNLWYPARAGFFGDWFGGPLARLFGLGVEDIPLKKATPASRIPGWAHAVYLREGVRKGKLRAPNSFGEALEKVLDLQSFDRLCDLPEPRAGAWSDAVLRGNAEMEQSTDGKLKLKFNGGVLLQDRGWS